MFAAVAAAIAMAMAWVGRGREETRRRKLESQLRLQMERDARISRELRNTATKLMNAQEEERRTIARELHDEVGQVLTAIKVELALAQRSIEAGGGSATPLVEAQTITDGALQTVRNLTQLLHPSALDDLGLPAAIDASLRGLARAARGDDTAIRSLREGGEGTFSLTSVTHVNSMHFQPHRRCERLNCGEQVGTDDSLTKKSHPLHAWRNLLQKLKPILAD